MPLSSDPDKRARQLANLRPGAGGWAPGATSALKSGLRSRAPSPAVIDPILDQVLEALEARVPIRDERGEIPSWLREQAWATAIKKLQVLRCAQWLALNGDTDAHGRLRPENDGLVRATEGFERSLERMAMTVKSHLSAGLTLRRTVDLASAMSHPDADERKRLLREIDETIDEDDE